MDVDWKAIKTAYITSTKSYKTLAKEYGISTRIINDRGGAEQWVKLRKDYSAKVVRNAVSRACEKESNKLATLAAAADKLSNSINGVFSDVQQFNRFIVPESSEGRTESVERVYKKADTRAMRDLAGAIKDLNASLRSLHDLPTRAELEAMAINRERLEIEKAKASQGIPDADTTGVVLIPSVPDTGDTAPTE
ncbi:MAG: hypothetical protein WC047_00230 [Kiritimatiellales bacterium]